MGKAVRRRYQDGGGYYRRLRCGIKFGRGDDEQAGSAERAYYERFHDETCRGLKERR